MKEILLKLIQALVDHPDDVDIDEQGNEESLILKVRVNSQDMGRLIGKSGRTIASIRSLMRIANRASDKRIQVELLEPEISETKPSTPKESE